MKTLLLPSFNSSIFAFIFFALLLSAALISQVSAQLEIDQDPKLDQYCGWNWNEANEYCLTPCPSGADKECPLNPAGRQQKCFQGAGCYHRMETLYWTGIVAVMFDADAHMANYKVTTTTTSTVAAAMGKDEDETASVNNNNIPTAALMTKIDENALVASLIPNIQNALSEQMYLVSVDARDQDYDRDCVAAIFPEEYDRDSPSVMALDVTIRISTRYIPNSITSYTNEDLGEIIIQAVEGSQQSIINTLKTSTPFFAAATAIGAVAEEDVAEAPSDSPSASPTRDFDQLFETRVDPTPTGANGLVFTVKTPKGKPSVLLMGMKFITNYEDTFEYEVYSRLGNWKGLVGKTDEFDLIASGQTKGRGPKTWVDVNQDDYVGTAVKGNETISIDYVGWKNVHVLGDGGERSFYLTTTKTFLKEDRTAVPILFSSPIKEESETFRMYELVKTNYELEVYEGDGVLDYPWPVDSNGKSPYYRRPRGPIVAFLYDRSPCSPIVNYTSWPCPYIQKTRLPTRKFLSLLHIMAFVLSFNSPCTSLCGILYR
ncbi:hypothetical protein ACHAWC_004023 [Mediolabrus comicus]